jgi:ribosome biogenesis GTPase / thiamine phosphate phosphatase
VAHAALDDKPPARHRGTVRRAGGGVYEVVIDGGGVVEASLRGRLKLQQRTGDRVVVGDRVELGQQAGEGYTIESVEPRRTELARQAPGSRGRKARVIVANVDQALIVFAAAQPDPNPRLLDRFLVQTEANGLAPILVVNKIELVPAAAAEAVFGIYEAIGYPVLYTSVAQRTGLEPLRERLRDRISVLTGPSGVGKSSLLNALDPALTLRTAEVGRGAGKGRHTTVTAELIPLAGGGYVADTPGLRELGLWGIGVRELDRHFPEFQEYLDRCRFAGSCTHLHEPGCGVREAVAAGTIAEQRYESYRVLREGEPG